MRVVYAFVLCFGLVLAYTTIFVGASEVHPCRRPCEAGESMICRYNFTMEWYRTLSKACYDCPFNVTDCYREQCIAGDGKVRLVLAVNRQVPGPAIEVCDGDQVEVRVTNQLEDGLSTSVHWHGQHVFNQVYFDGVGGITQCNIQHLETFVYNFTAGPVGTHWWHGHTGMQQADGAFGAFIVRQPAVQDLNSNLYDHDLSEHTVLLYNWHPVLSMEYYFQIMHVFDSSLPQSVMVNGRARVYNVSNYLGLVDTELTHAQTPLEVLWVQQGESYRLRFISAAAACPLQVSVDNHLLTVISVDGTSVIPRVLDVFIIHPGERYDFVLTADQANASYWLRALGLGDCEGAKADGAAIVRYEGAGGEEGEDPPGDPTLQREGILFSPVLFDRDVVEYGFNHTTILTDDVRSIHPQNYTDEVVDVKLIIGTDFNNNDNTRYNHKELYPVQGLKPRMFHTTPVIDNITFMLPPVPLLSQKEDFQEAWFCNRSTLEDPDDCLTEDLCMCVHRLRVPLDSVVELILFHEGRIFEELGHVMHLHGHNFRLLGLEKVGPALSRSEVEEMDREGRLKRNLISPSIRDSINVPDGGYVVLRFNANNPGFWFFHCHTDSHLQQGMALLFQVGELSDLPPLPAPFPRCGGMGYSNAAAQPPPPAPDTCPTGGAVGLRGATPLLVTQTLSLGLVYWVVGGFVMLGLF